MLVLVQPATIMCFPPLSNLKLYKLSDDVLYFSVIQTVPEIMRISTNILLSQADGQWLELSHLPEANFNGLGHWASV